MGIDSKTLTMQIIDSDPEGIKICRIQGSTMVTAVVPRRLLPRLRELPDIPRRGVYYLLQLDRGSLRRVYAGKTTNGIDRLNSHNSQKDWWNMAVMFLMPESELSSDVVAGLEATAIGHIKAHDGYESDNSDIPKPYVNPYNANYIEQLHREVLFRMKVLGYDLDQTDGDARGSGAVAPASEPAVPSDVSKMPEPVPASRSACEPDGGILCHTKANGVKGLGCFHPRDGSLEVLAGSQIDMTRSITNKDQQRYRQGVFEQGDIVREEDGFYVLKTSQVFDAVSPAANFVLGSSRNGWRDWYDERDRRLEVRKGVSNGGRMDDATAAPIANAVVAAFEKPVSSPESEPLFETKRRGVKGLGLYHPQDGTFEVLVGSQVDIDTAIIKNRKAQEARDSLLRTGGIVREGGLYVLKMSQSFKTPSQAAVFVLGGSQDGWKEWHAGNRTLGEVYSKEHSKR